MKWFLKIWNNVSPRNFLADAPDLIYGLKEGKFLVSIVCKLLGLWVIRMILTWDSRISEWGRKHSVQVWIFEFLIWRSNESTCFPSNIGPAVEINEQVALRFKVWTRSERSRRVQRYIPSVSRNSQWKPSVSTSPKFKIQTLKLISGAPYANLAMCSEISSKFTCLTLWFRSICNVKILEEFSAINRHRSIPPNELVPTIVRQTSR